MTYHKGTTDDVDEMIRQANRERALKAAATRRERQWLERLFVLCDTRHSDRGIPEIFSLRVPRHRL